MDHNEFIPPMLRGYPRIPGPFPVLSSQNPHATFWCIGTYGSASTWIYNVVLKVAECLMPERTLALGYAGPRWRFRSPPSVRVIKSHWMPAIPAAMTAARSQAIFLSVRDPRDSVVSLMQHHDASFASALQRLDASARFCARYAAHPRSLLLRYEDGFADDPATIDLVASRFGETLCSRDRERIVAETRRDAVEKLIAQLSELPDGRGTGDRFDPATQWHQHHAGRTGEVGRWRRELSAAQIAEIDRRLGSWMANFGYASALDPVAA